MIAVQDEPDDYHTTRERIARAIGNRAPMTTPQERFAVALGNFAYAAKHASIEVRLETREALHALFNEVVAESLSRGVRAGCLETERDEARAELARMQAEITAMKAKLVEAKQLLSYCAPRVQSYAECDATYCATSHDHPIRERIDAFLAEQP